MNPLCYSFVPLFVRLFVYWYSRENLLLGATTNAGYMSSPFILSSPYLQRIHVPNHYHYVFVTIFLITCAIACSGLLLFMHVYLIATNQSTIEFWINIMESRAPEYNPDYTPPADVADGGVNVNRPKAEWTECLMRLLTNTRECIGYRNKSTYRNPFDTCSIIFNLSRVFTFLPQLRGIKTAANVSIGDRVFAGVLFMYYPDTISAHISYYMSKYMTKLKKDDDDNDADGITADIETGGAIAIAMELTNTSSNSCNSNSTNTNTNTGGAKPRSEHLISISSIEQEARQQRGYESDNACDTAPATAGFDYSLVDTHSEEFLSDMAESIDTAAAEMNERFVVQHTQFNHLRN